MAIWWKILTWLSSNLAVLDYTNFIIQLFFSFLQMIVTFSCRGIETDFLFALNSNNFACIEMLALVLLTLLKRFACAGSFSACEMASFGIRLFIPHSNPAFEKIAIIDFFVKFLQRWIKCRDPLLSPRRVGSRFSGGWDGLKPWWKSDPLLTEVKGIKSSQALQKIRRGIISMARG